MVSKSDLVARIWTAFVSFRTGPPSRASEHGLPEMIPAGAAGSLIIPSEVARDIESFARIVHESGLQVSHTQREVSALVREAFGAAIVGTDLEADPKQTCDVILRAVQGHVTSKLPISIEPRTFGFGCWLIRDDLVSDLSFGPLRFETKQCWLDRLLTEKKVTRFLHARIGRRWKGRRLRPLANHINRFREEALVNSVGPCPMVCSVSTSGLADSAAAEKAMLAARLAMTALALLWERPSKPLEGFGLLADGGMVGREYVVFKDDGGWSHQRTKRKMVGTTWMGADDWKRANGNLDWLTAPVGETLYSILCPDRPVTRLKLTQSIWHALLWLHEAARAEEPLVATVKYGACLDALSGGRSERSILSLIEARLGRAADDRVTLDGRYTRNVVKRIFGVGRSQTLHGTNTDHAQDWSSTRDLAEHLTRLCFVEVLSWLEDNPGATDLSGALSVNARESK